MVIRVVLVAEAGEAFASPAGRDLLASSSHTFADLAAAIDRAFARWDISHLHEFSLSDGRVIGMSEVDEFGDGEDEVDENDLTLGTAGFVIGDTFEYVFDLGDSWEHLCTVLRDHTDPAGESGAVPREIVPIFGWGSIPDQYGRSGPESADDEEGENEEDG